MELDALVLGAGPAGLSVGSAVAERGGRVAVIEPSHRHGGAVRTVTEGGWTVELGPHTLQLETAEDAALVGHLGLGGEMLEADTGSAQRFIAWGGHLHGLRPSPASLLRSELLSLGGKLRLLSEVFRPRGGGEGETLRAFAERRLGAEAAERLVDPMVGGIFAGDPGRLVMAHALPSLHALERDHRSVLLGLARRKGPARRIVSFPGGLGRMMDALAARLPAGALRLGAQAMLLRPSKSGWEVAWREADGSAGGARARHLVVTAPPWQWASLPLEAPLGALLREAELVEAPPVALVVRGYDRAQVGHPLDGFGLLVPRAEGREVLGVLFPGSVFPGFVPPGKVLLSSFIGGARSPDLARQEDAALGATVDRELGTLLGARGKPEREWVVRWPRSIPQYTHTHGRLLAAMAEAEAALPGLAFVGCFRGGVSLMSTLRRGRELGSTLPLG
jgi:protoporphyrinogen/coproporphyrinogen III oxidase